MISRAPYEVLGVEPDAPPQEVKKAYKALAAKYHPDKYYGTEFEDIASEKMRQIAEAYRLMTGKETDSDMVDTDEYEPARVYLENCEMDEADAFLEGMESRSAEWYYLKSLILYSSGDKNSAGEYMRKALSLNPLNKEYIITAERLSLKKNMVGLNLKETDVKRQYKLTYYGAQREPISILRVESYRVEGCAVYVTTVDKKEICLIGSMIIE